MTLKTYVPISIGVFAAVILATRFFGVPFAPFAFVLLVGETLIGLQLENEKVSRFLEDLAHAFKPQPRRVNRLGRQKVLRKEHYYDEKNDNSGSQRREWKVCDSGLRQEASEDH